MDLAGVEADLERIQAGPGQGEIEDEHGARLDVGDAGGRFAELHRAFALDERGALVVHETDPHGVMTDLRPPPAHSEHEVGTGMDRRKAGHPDVLEEAQHRELALLIDQRVVGEDGEIEMQLRSPEWW